MRATPDGVCVADLIDLEDPGETEAEAKGRKKETARKAKAISALVCSACLLRSIDRSSFRRSLLSVRVACVFPIPLYPPLYLSWLPFFPVRLSSPFFRCPCTLLLGRADKNTFKK